MGAAREHHHDALARRGATSAELPNWRPLHARMDPILRSLGYTSGSVGARMSAVSRDPRFMFPEGDSGRAEILRFIQQRLDWIRAQMPRGLPAACAGQRRGAPAATSRRTRRADRPMAAQARSTGRSPGECGSTSARPRSTANTTCRRSSITEAIPGHVWQGEYAQQLPLIRSILGFNAYSEGWALYAEQLGDELGAYEDDPVGRLGYLQSLAFRACRMNRGHRAARQGLEPRAGAGFVRDGQRQHARRNGQRS